jgi:hypothetical protein
LTPAAPPRARLPERDTACGRERISEPDKNDSKHDTGRKDIREKICNIANILVKNGKDIPIAKTGGGEAGVRRPEQTIFRYFQRIIIGKNMKLRCVACLRPGHARFFEHNSMVCLWKR